MRIILRGPGKRSLSLRRSSRGARPLIAREYTAPRRLPPRHTMDPHIATAVILVLCLVLIIVTYVLGVEVGKASNLLTHPGYGSAMQVA